MVLAVSSFRVTPEEWSPFVCPVGPTPAHVYRRRESDTFARMLQARESPERRKGLRLGEILPSSNSMTAASVLLFLLLEPRLFSNEYFNQNESLYDDDLNIAFKVIDI